MLLNSKISNFLLSSFILKISPQTDKNTQVKVLIPFSIVFLPQHNAASSCVCIDFFVPSEM